MGRLIQYPRPVPASAATDSGSHSSNAEAERNTDRVPVRATSGANALPWRRNAPAAVQRLLSRTVWDHDRAMSAVWTSAVAGLDEHAGASRLRVGTLDETGQVKKGAATAGVQRQHVGCADGIANGIDTVHLAPVVEGVGEH